MSEDSSVNRWLKVVAILQVIGGALGFLLFFGTIAIAFTLGKVDLSQTSSASLFSFGATMIGLIFYFLACFGGWKLLRGDPAGTIPSIIVQIAHLITFETASIGYLARFGGAMNLEVQFKPFGFGTDFGVGSMFSILTEPATQATTVDINLLAIFSLVVIWWYAPPFRSGSIIEDRG